MKKLIFAALLTLLIVATIAPVASAAPPQSGGYWYTVKYGDTLSRIAYHHGIRLSRLIYANNIANPDHIYAGQNLWIPSYGGGGPGHAGKYHLVHYGETLSGIAYKYGVNAWTIAQANHIYNLNRIYAGQKLYIP